MTRSPEVPPEIADLLEDAVRRRPESLRLYVSSAGFKAHVDMWGPLLAEVAVELRSLQMPESLVQGHVSRVVDRALATAERRAAEGEAQMRAAFESLRMPVAFDPDLPGDVFEVRGATTLRGRVVEPSGGAGVASRPAPSGRWRRRW